MEHYIFDVDGTLTPSRKKMDPFFFDWFDEWSTNKNVYFVTGSDYNKTVEQLGNYLCEKVRAVYNCSGSVVTKQGRVTRESEWEPPKDLIDILEGWLLASNFSVRSGRHIEYRPGMVNFSIVGRNADHEQRQMYVKYDEANRERETIAHVINSEFADITATVGGETGIDIHPTGADKSQILVDFYIGDKIRFFGDRMEEGGNDYPLANALNSTMYLNAKSFRVKDWKDTWEKLKEIK
jgi:phosphomannomutase